MSRQGHGGSRTHRSSQSTNTCRRHHSLTVLVQRKVILGVAELLGAAGDEDVVVSEEVLKASDLRVGEVKLSSNLHDSNLVARSVQLPG